MRGTAITTKASSVHVSLKERDWYDCQGWYFHLYYVRKLMYCIKLFLLYPNQLYSCDSDKKKSLSKQNYKVLAEVLKCKSPLISLL